MLAAAANETLTFSINFAQHFAANATETSTATAYLGQVVAPNEIFPVFGSKSVFPVSRGIAPVSVFRPGQIDATSVLDPNMVHAMRAAPSNQVIPQANFSAFPDG